MPPEKVTWLNFWENAELISSKRAIAVNNFLIIVLIKGEGSFLPDLTHKIVFNAHLL
jgi:hypothetical protein